MRAQRLHRLPPYLFVEMARAKDRARAAGVEVLDLGIGDPEDPTPDAVVEDMRRAVLDPRHHRYVAGEVEEAFKQAAAGWLERRFGVRLDPTEQILPLLGTKEGIGHLGLAVLDPGEGVLLPDPGYPVYTASAVLAGATLQPLTLREEDGFLPRLTELPAEVCRAARMIFLNYPNNPTAATCEPAFFEQVVAWAERHEILVAHDAAYSEICYDDYRAPSVLSAATPRSRVVEFHSLSKTWNMCGWRVGFAAGRADIISALAALKSNLDSGVFGAVLTAATLALSNVAGPPPASVRAFERRRDLLCPALVEAGWTVLPVRASFFVWARPPQSCASMALAAELLERVGVATAPGVGFGSSGEGYVRFSLTARTDVVARAAARLAALPAESLGRKDADVCRP